MTRKFYNWLCKLIRDGDVHPFYISKPWRRVRYKALSHYNFECQRCKHDKAVSVLTRATEVHHAFAVKKYPQYALDIFVYDNVTHTLKPNLIPLCHDCHTEIESPMAKTKRDADSRYPERW